jgi:branched-chain amino acid transport system substrate-binding protein
MLRSAFMGALVAAAIALPVSAQDAYVIGVTGALTGPPASTNAPPIEGLRLYVDRLNAAGGVNGKKIQLVVLDDQAEPSKAAANAKRLLTQDNVKLLILSSLSSTFAPVVAETKRANVPLMFMGAVCPKEVYPPAEALQFCTTAYAGGYDSRATLAFVKEAAKEPVRIGLVAMAIPLSRGEIDYAEEHAKTAGMTPVDKEVIPPPTADYTPFATKLKDANPNWIFSWAPGSPR